MKTTGIGSLERKRVQIVGLSPSHKRAPIVEDSWGIPWNPLCHRYSVWFEMHDRRLWERRGPEYLEQLQNAGVPIYMHEAQPDIPMSRRFPLEDAIEAIGADYFNSSIAYMMALAILEGRDMDVWGVDNHTDEEWAYERPCNEYLIGVARGRGLDVWIHPDSSLLKFYPDIMFLDERQHYRVRYGVLDGEE